jgi:hypothetical protein
MAAVLERYMTDRQYVVGDSVTVADFVLAYTLDWAGEEQLLGDCPRLRSYMERMYARPRAAPRIAQAMASVGMGRCRDRQVIRAVTSFSGDGVIGSFVTVFPAALPSSRCVA